MGETAMATAKKRSGVSVTQFVILIVATIALSLVVDFGRKVAVYHHLQLEEARLDKAVEYEKDRRDYLEWLKGYVQTDSFVGDWARRERKMVQPGETSVVLNLAESSNVPQTRSQVESLSSEGPYWQEWWNLFSDSDDQPEP
jgi:hypothetical protein